MSTAAPRFPTMAGFFVTRLVGNLFIRFPYVFINKIAAGFGVDVATMTIALGARELGGVISPLAGSWIDRGHTRRVAVWAGLIAGISCLAAATSYFPLFVIVMVTGGAAKVTVDLAQNAWIGHNVPLSGRSRITGIIELTWAGAFLAGIPILGWFIELYSWKAAFIATGPALGFFAVVSAIGLADEDPEHNEHAMVSLQGTAPLSVLLEPTETTAHQPRTRIKPAVWVFCVCQPLAGMLIFAVNGDWFVTQLGMSTAGLALATSLLGVAELIGTSLVIAFGDRIGPLRGGMWAIGFTVIPLIALLGVGTNVVAGIALMVLMDVSLEYSFVAILPMFSELDLDENGQAVNRGRSVSHVFVLIMVSRAIGSAVAGVIYTARGFNTSIICAIVACTVAVAVLAWARTGQ